MNGSKTMRLLSVAVMLYMLFALIWWSILLFSKSAEITVLKEELIKNEQPSESALEEKIITIEQEFARQKRMIIGEGVVFGILLFAGLFFINRAYDKELKSNQRQKNFLLAITHELKSPLASIKLILETFKKRNLNEEQTERFSSNALEESGRLENMINNLLISAKLEADYAYNYEQGNLFEFASEILQIYQQNYPAYLFKLSAETEIPNSDFDKESLRSVFRNLLDNAIKYSSELKEVSLKAKSDSKYIAFSIIDQGPGIPDEEKTNVFKKFYRIGSEETRKSKGTGLGLFIVQEIIKAHKGTVKIENHEPKGTIVNFKLPINS